MLYHVLNRANNRTRIFENDGDYLAFLRVVCDTLQKRPMRIISYSIMPNHWHFLLWPESDGDLGNFMQAVTTTHVRRWHLHRNNVGMGHLYQGPYKAFPVEDDQHFYSVGRYIERNALRANLVARAEEWRWSSLWQRLQAVHPAGYPRLDDWPLPCPENWTAYINQPETEAELAALRKSVIRGCPYGSSDWQRRTAERLGAESTLRERGRPRKKRL